jgi:hypothetical protein
LRQARHELHGDEVDLAFGSDVIDRNDVGMVERRGGFGFLNEWALSVSGVSGRGGNV